MVVWLFGVWRLVDVVWLLLCVFLVFCCLVDVVWVLLCDLYYVTVLVVVDDDDDRFLLLVLLLLIVILLIIILQCCLFMFRAVEVRKVGIQFSLPFSKNFEQGAKCPPSWAGRKRCKFAIIQTRKKPAVREYTFRRQT